MLKRLSYPLAWVEGLTTGETSKSSESDSAPNTGDSNQSVFSKVFSRYVFVKLIKKIKYIFIKKKIINH